MLFPNQRISLLKTMSSFQFERVINKSVKDLDKGQDFALCGESVVENGIKMGQKFTYGIIADGHGTHTFIQFLRELNWEEIVFQDNPWEFLHEKYLKELYIRESSGSTLIIMRAFDTYIQSICIGDSQLVILVNGEFAYKSTPHKLNNPLEQERLTKPGTTYKGQLTKKYDVPQIRNARSLQARPCIYQQFFQEGSSQMTILATTQALGHNCVTGYEPEYNECFFSETDHVKVVFGSDGLFDMLLIEEYIQTTPPLTAEDFADLEQDKRDILMMDAEEIVEKCEARWKKQDWAYHYYIKNFDRVATPISFEGNYDDVSAVTFTKKGIWDPLLTQDSVEEEEKAEGVSENIV
jgi:serine/threonine protein phosphatase PrpC